MITTVITAPIMGVLAYGANLKVPARIDVARAVIDGGAETFIRSIVARSIGV